MSMRPNRRLVKTGISKNAKKGLKQIEALTEGKFYRKDLTEMAKAKYHKIKTSFKKKARKITSRRSKKN